MILLQSDLLVVEIVNYFVSTYFQSIRVKIVD